MCLNPSWAAPPASLKLSSGNEVSLRTYAAKGDIALLWFSCDEGHSSHEARAAQSLALRGIETWQPDVLDAHFLPLLQSSMEQIPPEEISEIITQAIRLSGKKIMLVTAGHGAQPVLLGAKAWLDQAPSHERTALLGAILFHPSLYSVAPAPGVEAQYHPVVAQTTLPVFIYQGQLSPARWWLEHLKMEFARSGNKQVFSKILPGARNHFYVRNDATAEEIALAQSLPDLIQDAIKQLETTP